MRKSRRSTMSTSAPAGIANRNIGRVFATCTRETVSGSESRLVMSQPHATLYIQPPIFDTTVAIQMSVNVRWRKGAHAELGCDGDVDVVTLETVELTECALTDRSLVV